MSGGVRVAPDCPGQFGQVVWLEVREGEDSGDPGRLDGLREHPAVPLEILRPVLALADRGVVLELTEDAGAGRPGPLEMRVDVVHVHHHAVDDEGRLEHPADSFRLNGEAPRAPIVRTGTAGKDHRVAEGERDVRDDPAVLEPIRLVEAEGLREPVSRTPDVLVRQHGNRCVGRHGGMMDDPLARARKLREAGELEEARQLLLELRAERPDDPHVAVETAWVHDSMGLEEQAVEHYEAALAGELTEQEARGAYLGLGSTLRTLGRDEDSDRVLRAGIERFPDFPALRAFHAMTLYNLRRPREAVQQLLEVLLETADEPSIDRYRRALTAYAEDLDRSWLSR